MKNFRVLAVLIISGYLAGCGMTVPEMHQFYNKSSEGLDEAQIAGQVKCELALSVRDILAKPPIDGADVEWLGKWGAKVQMTLNADEKGIVAPGLTYSSPFEKATQTFSLAVGATGSSEATREETIEFTYNLDDLLKQQVFAARVDDKNPSSNYRVTNCDHEDGVLIHSDLKISDFLKNKILLSSLPGILSSTKDKSTPAKSPFSTLSYKVTFVVAYGVNLTPSWKLVRFSVDPTGSLFSGTRMKTQQILITLAEATSDKKSLSPEGLAAYQAQQIGSAVANAIANTSRQQQ